MERCVEPEILDELAVDDAEAVESRRDLRRINFLMGNEQWIEAQVAACPASCAKGIVELGAGEGMLAARLATWGRVTGVDLMPRPTGLAEQVEWRQGDVFELADGLSGGVLVANLFLHHFEEAGLALLGGMARRFERVVAVEPLRTEASMMMGKGMLPFVNRVTRHDMMVSIRAGFVPGELGRMLGLEGWKISERSSWRGGLRVLACKD